jgi:hypothetical protein
VVEKPAAKEVSPATPSGIPDPDHACLVAGLSGGFSDSSAKAEVCVWIWKERAFASGPVSANKADRPAGIETTPNGAIIALAERMWSRGRSAGTGL